MKNAPREHSAILSISLIYHLSLKKIRLLFCLFLSGHLRQVLLYSEDSNQCANPYSLFSIGYPPEAILDPSLTPMLSQRCVPACP